MRSFVIVGLVLLLGAVHRPAAAQDAETLRRELEQVRAQFERMKQDYQKAIDGLSERIRSLEAAPRQAVGPPASAQAPTPMPAVPAQPSLGDIARPREPFSLFERRGAGQLLFDIGIVGDLVGNLAQRNVEKADAGTFAGRENRFFPREVEINLFGRIDPYAQGQIRFEFAEEFEGGERSLATALAEAHLTLLTLPGGLSATLGRLPVRFGSLSHLHREALPQPDPPQVLLRFLGEEQVRENGLQVSWVAPTPFYLEALAGVFDGDNEVAFGRGSLKDPLLTGRLWTFFELERSGAIQLGLSAASGETAERRRNTLVGTDVKYKLLPEGWRHPLLTLAGEILHGRRTTDVFDEARAGEDRARRRWGWYTYAELQPWRRWIGGLRYDWTQFPVGPGDEWAVEPYLAFLASDFLRFRLAYKHTERSHRDLFAANGASARIVDELLFQATFFLGAHPPHPF